MEAIFAKNAKRKIVVMRQGGLSYEISKKDNDDPFGPTAKARAYYILVFTDEKVCQSSYESGKTFKLNLPKGIVIKDQMKTVPLMKEGQKWKLFLPYDIASGCRGNPPDIPPF